MQSTNEQEFPSQIFMPFRSLGIVTNEVPFHFFSVKTNDFVALCTGKSYQVLDCKHLRLSRVGPNYTRKIKALCSYDRFILFAAGADIVVSLQSDIIKVLKGHHGKVYKLLVIGIFMISIGEDNVMIIWNLQQMEEQGRIELGADFHATSLMHPDTYLNKVLVGSSQGHMAIFNLRSKKLVYQFRSFGSSITCIAQSPVVDVVGVGLADGRIVIHNLKLDKTVFTFTQTEGAVTTLAFRSDKQPLLCSGSPNGQIALWDLTKRRLLNVFNAHYDGPVIHAAFLHDEPVLVTTGADNSIKMWVFDMGASDTGRLLRARLGHPTPPKVVRWFGNSLVISAGGHCLRSQKVMADSGTTEFGVASQSKKLRINTNLPPIADFAVNPIKQKEWDDVLTCHENSTKAYTWSTIRVALGTHALMPTEKTPTPIKSVAISACGNFGYIGTASGWIDKFNMQSGLHRGACQGTLHAAAVVSMCCDAGNRHVLSASLDGFVKVWNMDLELEFSIDLGSPVSKLSLSPHSQLLAIACDDLIVRLYDIDAKRTVRKFVGHDNLITDIVFSADERWIITSSTDNTVRVWDIPTGKLIDWFAIKKTVNSLSISPTGDFLATTHANERSVSVWSNKAYFSGVMLKAVPEIAPAIDLPAIRKPTQAEGEDDEDEEETEIKQEMESETIATRTPTDKRKRDSGDSEDEGDNEVKQEEGVALNSQLDKSLITLSSLPKSRWITLADIDLIKERNKAPTKAVVPDAPFFIPTVSGLNPTFDANTNSDLNKPNQGGSRILSMNMEKPQTKFMQLVANKNYDDAMDFLSSLSTSGIDFELHSIPNSEDCSWFLLVLKFFRHQLKTNARFELVQAYINRFLKVHSDILIRPEVSKSVGKLLQAHKAGWDRLEAIFHSNLCLVNYFSSLHT